MPRRRGYLTSRQIRQLREHLGQSVGEFAQRFLRHRGTVHRWETGRPPKAGGDLVILLALWRRAGFPPP
jgi:DNA-binding transcriptional regulator YiaG